MLFHLRFGDGEAGSHPSFHPHFGYAEQECMDKEEAGSKDRKFIYTVPPLRAHVPKM